MSAARGAAANAAASGVCTATGGLGSAGPAPSAGPSAFVEPGEVSSADGGASGDRVRAKRPDEVRARPSASAGAEPRAGRRRGLSPPRRRRDPPSLWRG